MGKPVLTKEFFEEEYINNGKTYQKIARESGWSKDTILYYAKKFGVISRKTGRTPLRCSVGDRFGSLTVVDIKRVYVENDKKHPRVQCICDCGQELALTVSTLVRGQRYCWNCRNKYISCINYRGVGDLSGDFWCSIKESAKARNLEFTISIEEAWQLYLFQHKRCALSGIDIVLSRNNKREITASLDRIDSSKGYVKNNIQWVYKDLNLLKSNFNESYFIYLCGLVSSYHKKTSIQ